MNKRSSKQKNNYKEGTWFGVPLYPTGYAVGRVARLASEGRIILVYLFGPKRACIPTVDELEHLEPSQAIKVILASDLGLFEGSWPVIGDSTHWDRKRWTMPPLIRKDDLSQIAWQVTYSDDDPNTVVSEQRIAYDTKGLESSGFYGSGAVASVLSNLLEA